MNIGQWLALAIAALIFPGIPVAGIILGIRSVAQARQEERERAWIVAARHQRQQAARRIMVPVQEREAA